jgi:hypothetical protein
MYACIKKFLEICAWHFVFFFLFVFLFTSTPAVMDHPVSGIFRSLGILPKRAGFVAPDCAKT